MALRPKARDWPDRNKAPRTRLRQVNGWVAFTRCRCASAGMVAPRTNVSRQPPLMLL
jgi:hypothetical protein